VTVRPKRSQWNFQSELEAVDGAKSLCDWFGYWPGFHDAEVISLHLNRRGASSLLLHTWEMTKETDARGYYILAKHIVVEFVLEEILDLSLSGFSHQNVIFGLTVETVENGFRLTLEDSYGVSGNIDAKQISIRLTPGKPKDAS
jgi:immunity protein 50 of polymorphic toxin system